MIWVIVDSWNAMHNRQGETSSLSFQHCMQQYADTNTAFVILVTLVLDEHRQLFSTLEKRDEVGVLSSCS